MNNQTLFARVLGDTPITFMDFWVAPEGRALMGELLWATPRETKDGLDRYRIEIAELDPIKEILAGEGIASRHNDLPPL